MWGGKTEDVDKGGTSNEDVEGNSDETSDEEVEDEEEVVDLGGIEVAIGDWWTSDEPEPPKTQQEEDTLLYQQQIQGKHNFTIKRVAISDWGGMEELFTTSVMADDPAADMFVLMGGWTAQPLANGMLYDIASLDNFDLTESKWNKNTLELMTYGDSIYGHSIGRSSPTTGVFWNKRMFEEAGIDPELPYDLQASGEWIWEEFEKLADTLTRDIDNDGTVDTYALASFSVDETLEILYDTSQTEIVNDYERFVYGTDGGADYIWGVYALDVTPAEKIEEIATKWATLIDDANR